MGRKGRLGCVRRRAGWSFGASLPSLILPQAGSTGASTRSISGASPALVKRGTHLLFHCMKRTSIFSSLKSTKKDIDLQYREL